MGATTFHTTALGKDADEAFRRATDEALYDYGHAGYTGTIAEKDGYHLFELPKGVTAQRVLDKIDDAHWAMIVEQNPTVYSGRHDRPNARQRAALAYLRKHFGSDAARIMDTYDDKWGPALCLQVTGAAAATVKERARRKGTHDKVFIFCGYASC